MASTLSILNFVASHPGASAAEIALGTRCSTADVNRLRSEVLLSDRHMGAGQPVGYFVTNKGLDALES